MGCGYFNQGKGSCLKGDRCTFSHDPEVEVARREEARAREEVLIRLAVQPRLLGAISPEVVHPLGSSSGRPIDPTKYKTKPCDNFARGTCTLGDRCSFRHNY